MKQKGLEADQEALGPYAERRPPARPRLASLSPSQRMDRGVVEGGRWRVDRPRCPALGHCRVG